MSQSQSRSGSAIGIGSGVAWASGSGLGTGDLRTELYKERHEGLAELGLIHLRLGLGDLF